MMQSDAIKKGFERGPHRSLLKATGLSDKDIRKPIIAIANSYTDIVPGHCHLDAVGEYVKQQIRDAGGTPIVFNTIAICDGIAMGHTGMKYSLASRETIADSVEAMVAAHRFDAMICIPNCDKIIPGMFLAAIRCNIPTIFASGGPMEAGRVAGCDVDLVDQFYAVAKHKIGTMSSKQFKEYEDNTCPTCGSCSGMFTANSMNCLSEAIGMSLPGNGTILATSPERKKMFKLAAMQIVKMAKQFSRSNCSKAYPLLPRNIMKRQAFANALTLDMAMGGSSNTVLHLLAMANEAGVKFTLDDIEQISRRSPNICRIAPSSTLEGKTYHMQDAHQAGGITTIMHQLVSDKPGLLKTDVMTVTGKTLGDNLKKYSLRSNSITKAAKQMYRDGCKSTGRTLEQVKAMYLDEKLEKLPTINASRINKDDVIRSADTAFTDRGALRVLKGNIAIDGSVVKVSGLESEMYKFTGRCVICESQEDACEIILANKIKAGDVVVIRNEGPKGGPGMQEMLAPTSYIKAMDLYNKVFLITDGRFSGGTSGPAIGHIAPEAAAGGEIALLRNGDIIEIDIAAGSLNAKVSKAEFARRRKNYNPLPCPITYGMLGRYAAHATSADTGAVLNWPGKTTAPK